MAWWENEYNMSLLVSSAQEICETYLDRPIVSIGHSPSWLVYTVGELRKSRGEEPNIEFIPYSDREWEYVDYNSFDTNQNDEVIFERKPRSASYLNDLKNYFNHLSKSQKDVLLNPKDKPVLLDLAKVGEGIVSFLELLEAKHQNQLSDHFDLHLFKIRFYDKMVDLVLERPQTSDIKITAKVETGIYASLMNRLAGGQGLNKFIDEGIGRFVPYYAPHKQDQPIHIKHSNPKQIEIIQKEIQKIIAFAQTQKGMASIQEKVNEMRGQERSAITTWGRGYGHPGGFYGIPPKRKQTSQYRP